MQMLSMWTNFMVRSKVGNARYFGQTRCGVPAFYHSSMEGPSCEKQNFHCLASQVA